MNNSIKSKPTTLYDYQFSGNGYKIRLALKQLGIPVVIEYRDLLKGETHTDEFLTKNPMGQIPVLALDDGNYMRESNAILYWLAENTWLMPTQDMERIQVLQWMFFEQSNIEKVLGRTRFLKTYPNFREVASQEWDVWYSEGNRALRILNDHLQNNVYLVANAYSAADICLYAYVHTANEGGFDLGRYPNVVSWLARVRSQDSHLTIDD